MPVGHLTHRLFPGLFPCDSLEIIDQIITKRYRHFLIQVDTFFDCPFLLDDYLVIWNHLVGAKNRLLKWLFGLLFPNMGFF
jgi:hypothetical protein